MIHKYTEIPGEFDSPGISVIVWNEVLSFVVCFQIHFFHFRHKRISWVCTGTLVIECVFYHFIQSIQEGFLIDTIILNRSLNTNSFFQICNGFDEVAETEVWG